jgi:hypothetical protein
MTCPCLLRPTRQILQVAELLPWPSQGPIIPCPITPYGARNKWTPSFLEGTVLNQRTREFIRWIEPSCIPGLRPSQPLPHRTIKDSSIRVRCQSPSPGFHILVALPFHANFFSALRALPPLAFLLPCRRRPPPLCLRAAFFAPLQDPPLGGSQREAQTPPFIGRRRPSSSCPWLQRLDLCGLAVYTAP